jgi:hypothetical protein
MKTIQILISLLLAMFCVSCYGPGGYGRSGYGASRTGHYSDTQLTSFTVYKKVDGKLVKVDTVRPDQVGKYQKGKFEWLPATETHKVIDMRGQRMPGPPSGGRPYGNIPPGFGGYGPRGGPVMQMTSPSGNQFNFQPGGGGGMQYIYTTDPRPKGYGGPMMRYY